MADVEGALMAFFDDLAYTCTYLPLIDDLRTLLANNGRVLQINRNGGGSDRDNDYPVVRLQAFASPSATAPRAANDFADAIEARFRTILDYGPQMAGGVVIEDPQKTSGPLVSTPWPDTAIKVADLIYRLTIPL